MLEFTAEGIYCARADVYLDPWKPVKRALITHGHSDHARWGHQQYLCTEAAKPVIAHRLNYPQIETVRFGQTINIAGVSFSFHPAGHVIGSAQIRVEHKGEVWVFTGDYKLQSDGLTEPFQPVRCQTLITESTFGLPIYKWQPQDLVFNQINDWWRKNKAEGKVSVLAAYALGKAQRILANVDSAIGKIFVHGAIHSINRIVEGQGYTLPATHTVTKEMKKSEWEGALVVCPPSAIGSPWIRKFYPYSVAIASGWMALRGTRRRRGADRGFALSDHADWNELNIAVAQSGAERVFVTHGYTDVFARWLSEKGLEAAVVKTAFEGELNEGGDESTPPQAES